MVSDLLGAGRLCPVSELLLGAGNTESARAWLVWLKVPWYTDAGRQSLSQTISVNVSVTWAGDLGHFCPHMDTCSPTHIATGSLVGSKASLVTCPEKMFPGTTVFTVSDLGQPSDTVLDPVLERNPPHTGDPQVRAPDWERLGDFLHPLLQT